MLLTLKTTRYPATDLGYLLYKNPSKFHSYDLPVGKAYVFFPEIDLNNCCATLLLDIDPIALAKKKTGHSNDNFVLGQFVNDRPYVASSFLSIAIAKVFNQALKGVCKEKPELLSSPWPFEVCIAALPCHSKTGKDLICSLLKPLGYQITIEAYPLNEKNPDWGEAQSYTVILKKNCFLKDLLSHLYVLIPVLDDQKHYWVAEAEVEKLLKHGEGWLSSHPCKDLIVSRYLKRQRDLTNEALTRLQEEDGQLDIFEKVHANEEEKLESLLSLHLQRMQAVVNILKEHHICSVVDLGCGEGVLINSLLEDSSFTRILGVDVSFRQLERAKQKLNLDWLPPLQRKRVDLIQGSLNYVDKRIQGFDAATLIEVIEHLDIPRLSALEHVVFGEAKPKLIVITTPNAEYNVKFEQLSAGTFRHNDHRFEWTRQEFKTWAEKVASQYGYSVSFQAIGPLDENLGGPTQMGIFTKR
jgi:3' terminal RNA ribose 2'-O-methyltransferase Hen1